jgi:ABC-type branched-subunit amino acid transport system ATPase component
VSATHEAGPGASVADELALPPEGDAAQSLAQIMLAERAAEPQGEGLAKITGGRSALPLAIMFGLSLTDSIDRATGQVLLPEIRDAFGLTDTGVTAIVMVAVLCSLVLTVPISFWADRGNRVRILLGGATVFTAFSVFTGLVPNYWWMYLIARSGAAIGLATVLPTHNSLLADYYDLPHRPKVYSIHGAANGIGIVTGFLVAGQLGEHFGWRWAYLVIVIPNVILLILGLRLREPDRGHFERRAMGVSGAALALQEDPPSLEEAHRMVHRVESLRRLFYAIPFLAISLVGFGLLANLLYEQEFGLGPADRGVIEAVSEIGQLVGIAIAASLGTRLVRKDPARMIRFIFVVCVAAGGFVAAFALAPTVFWAVAARIGISAMLAAILPSVFAALSLAVPPRARSSGFSLAVLYVLPGLPILLLASWIGDNFGIRVGLLMMVPVLLVGGYIVSTAHKTLDRDIRNVWTTAATRAELLAARKKGEIKQLLVRKLDVSYGDVRILFGVDFEVDQGEIVALLGTNGAGKSTLLRAITGVVEATNGAIVFDGRDITSSPPHEIAGYGIAMVPGGQGVFPSLTVAENLKVATWGNHLQARIANRGATAGADQARDRVEQVLDTFPILRERLGDPAANLSGGQQQMLALGMAFLSRPKLLVIDELSLGLAPVVVEQLLTIVRAIRDQGTTVILVEQSVNVALTLAETAYFMEKGEIRFHGPTAELLERPDVLRSVFLEGAAAGLGGNGDQPDRTVTPAGAEQVLAGAAPALELVHLSVRFGGIRAVDDVSLAVRPGEIVGIIGPNGAGKTTVFDLISGFTRPDGGRILLGGRDLTGAAPDARARLGLGRSFQDARLFPAMTVEETIKVAMERFIDARDPFNAMLRLPIQQDSEHALEHRVDELIDLLGIDAFRAKFVRELSTGSRRVVDLACVLAHRPSVVLLDEPSSGIAQRESEALAPLVRRIRDALGASVLIIEHDMPLVTAVADRLVALDQGRVVVEGPAAQVLDHPEVVASYLGNRDDVIARSGQRARSTVPDTPERDAPA